MRDKIILLQEQANAPLPLPTVAEIADAWKDWHWPHIVVKTQECYASPLKRVVNSFGATSIDKLTTSQIDAVILSMKAEGKSAQTIRDFKSVVNQICNYAISRNPPLILTNPCIAVKIPRGLPKSTQSAPDDNTIQTIFDTADSSDPFSVFVLTLLCTGNRRGELIPMLWGQLDFELNQITVDHALRNDFVKTNFCNTRKNRVS